MEYKVVVESDFVVLVRMVNEEIQKGWQPLGGVAIEPSGGYAQAMTRHSPTYKDLKWSQDVNVVPLMEESK